ncbi:MAG TPA: TetR/AcrR family transcriptional regulator [Pseudomonadales bacterium]|nr:TetR/AcrR family transcriptional regulator [Pseudomonadales bacterium]
MTDSSQETVLDWTTDQSPRSRLLRAAAHLFKTKGYDRTTVRDLAKLVGIQSGSIFHHFKTKEHILVAVMTDVIHYNTARMVKHVNAAETTRDKVLALIRCELQAILGETSEAMTSLVFEWRALSPENQADILKMRETYESIWLGVLDKAKEEGLTVLDSFILRRLLTGALSWTVNWYRHEGRLSIDQLAEHALTLAIKQ